MKDFQRRTVGFFYLKFHSVKISFVTLPGSVMFVKIDLSRITVH